MVFVNMLKLTFASERQEWRHGGQLECIDEHVASHDFANMLKLSFASERQEWRHGGEM